MAADSHRCTSVAAELEGTLLISGRLFPYFLLVALEAGGPLRAAALLAVYPLAALLGAAFSDDLPLLAMTFLSTAGLRAGDVAAVARATLPRFFLADLRGSAFRRLARHDAGERYVVTRLPRLLAEPFVREYLGADVRVVGTELRVVGRRFSGTVVSPGVAAGADRSLGALVAVLGRDRIIDVGLCTSGSAGDRKPAFLQVCQERRVVSTPEKAPATPLPRSEYPKPLVFHDGRLVCRPDPRACLAILLWLPLGVVLSVTRLLLGFLPHGAGLLLAAATGFRIRGDLGGATEPTAGRRGTLFACNHQTLMDPVILSTVLRRKVTAVTYSLSCFSELIAPIPTVRLTRDRGRDSRIMRSSLERGDLVVCPEGTTCREPYLLRFSPLFAEVAGEVTPTAVRAGGAMFHGSTVRGHKWLDSVFFLMNPAPWYEIRLLAPVATGGGASSHDVANGVQRVIGDELGFECTGLTRRDKYRMIAGHDGVDARSSSAS
ncbi:Glycerol-3-phosphate 2-O-acyltransferase 6 [Dichanthelium oligosanthes]|uniref:Glycerol-3-phosphate 2-O-acyltransferase 6 n=1 Tax=Dichanthelium oligosanthes TaxID=888268 RepID=A0A1E5VPQ4_9POAL|nr:Glycerol-3-phosphate 2-O-acyltransferase 6 [Dichanthelium oligosanthes]